jgi:hypothetical protein
MRFKDGFSKEEGELSDNTNEEQGEPLCPTFVRVTWRLYKENKSLAEKTEGESWGQKAKEKFREQVEPKGSPVKGTEDKEWRWKEKGSYMGFL